MPQHPRHALPHRQQSLHRRRQNRSRLPRTAAQPSRSFRSPAVSQEFTGTRHAAAPEPAEPADPLYEDLEGESQPGTRSSSAAVRTSRKRKPHRVISALVMTIVIIAVSVLLSTLLIVYGRDLLGINSDSTTKIVTIPQGASMNDIAETLQKEDIISKPSFFVFIAGMSNKDKDIKPGDHELRPDMAYETILSELVSDPMDSSCRYPLPSRRAFACAMRQTCWRRTTSAMPTLS